MLSPPELTRARAHLEHRHLEDARVELERCATLATPEYECVKLLGSTYAKMSAFGLAKRYFRKARSRTQR